MPATITFLELMGILIIFYCIVVDRKKLRVPPVEFVTRVVNDISLFLVFIWFLMNFTWFWFFVSMVYYALLIYVNVIVLKKGIDDSDSLIKN